VPADRHTLEGGSQKETWRGWPKYLPAGSKKGRRKEWASSEGISRRNEQSRSFRLSEWGR